MTKKDYELIASALASERPRFQHPSDTKKMYQCHRYQWSETVRALATSLEDENVRFNRYKFIQACGLTSEYSDETVALD